MRHDFGKVVTERPRRGSRNRNAKVRKFGKMVRTEDGIEYEGYTKIPCSWKAYGWGHKEFTDVLGPIEGFLINSCGRRWDLVYSELCRTLGKGTWPVRHILTDHANVATNTYRDGDGDIWNQGEYGEERITRKKYEYGEFYVEPETGILRYTGIRIWKSSDWNRDEHAGDKGRHPDGRFFVRLNGLWFLGHYEIWTEEQVIDVAFPDTRLGFFVKEKSASKKELARKMPIV